MKKKTLFNKLARAYSENQCVMHLQITKLFMVVSFISATVLTYGQVGNGDFETPGGADWDLTLFDVDPGTDPLGTFETTGGNPTGYFKFVQGSAIGDIQQSSHIENTLITTIPAASLSVGAALTFRCRLDAKSDVVFNNGSTHFRFTVLTSIGNKNLRLNEYTSTGFWDGLDKTTSGGGVIVVPDPVTDVDVNLRLDFGQFPVDKTLEIDNVTLDILIDDEVLSTHKFTNEGTSIILYPNPISDVLNIKMPANTVIKNVTINSLLGETLIESSTTEQLNTSGLHSGIYLLKLEMEDGIIATKRFIVN